jgi:hypothetical protein
MSSRGDVRAIVNGVITNNPFGGTPYQVRRESCPAAEKTRESYSGRVIYEEGEAVTVGQVTVCCPTVAAYIKPGSPLIQKMGVQWKRS